jgi:hypothetical protein
MPDAQLVVALKRLADDLREFKSSLARDYPSASRQVTSSEHRRRVATLAETWISNLSQRKELSENVSDRHLGDLNVLFQRLLVYSDHATVRRRYDGDVRSILRDYTAEVIVPLMQAGTGDEDNTAGAEEVETNQESGADFKPTAFVGHSFAREDAELVNTFINILEALGVQVVTGSKPKADKISDKVKALIEKQHLFVGIFTRRDKLEGKNSWTTSTWVIEEKAYAVAQKRPLILLKEADVESIGGMHGDYQFIEFSRDKIGEGVVGLLQLFTLNVQGLQKA